LSLLSVVFLSFGSFDDPRRGLAVSAIDLLSVFDVSLPALLSVMVDTEIDCEEAKLACGRKTQIPRSRPSEHPAGLA